VGEGCRKRSGALDAGKVDLANVGTVVEAENRLCCVVRDALCETGDVFVKGAAHKLVVGEDKGLCGIESNGDDVLGVCFCVAHDLLDRTVFANEEFFIYMVCVCVCVRGLPYKKTWSISKQTVCEHDD
jgi:hypothetical protein